MTKTKRNPAGVSVEERLEWVLPGRVGSLARLWFLRRGIEMLGDCMGVRRTALGA